MIHVFWAVTIVIVIMGVGVGGANAPPVFFLPNFFSLFPPFFNSELMFLIAVVNFAPLPPSVIRVITFMAVMECHWPHSF